MTLDRTEAAEIEVAGIPLEMSVLGNGRPLLFLHPGHPGGPLKPGAAVLEYLAKTHRVMAPVHPGFGAKQAPRHFTTIDDLAYFYLDLLDALGAKDAAVVGVQLGGFIAAEMAVKSTARIGHLVLADAVGIKTGDRESRDIADIYAMTDKQLAALVYADPALAPNPKKLPESDLFTMARSRETTARYAWSPFMHDPKLKDRLHRIGVPTLVLWGEADRVVTPDYGRSFAAAIPGARFKTIAGAGHFPHLERPEDFAQSVLDFLG